MIFYHMRRLWCFSSSCETNTVRFHLLYDLILRYIYIINQLYKSFIYFTHSSTHAQRNEDICTSSLNILLSTFLSLVFGLVVILGNGFFSFPFFTLSNIVEDCLWLQFIYPPSDCTCSNSRKFRWIAMKLIHVIYIQWRVPYWKWST